MGMKVGKEQKKRNKIKETKSLLSKKKQFIELGDKAQPDPHIGCTGRQGAHSIFEKINGL